MGKRINFEPKVFDINIIIDRNIELIKEDFIKKRIELINNVSLNRHIFADENMISAVIRNLLTNALKFTPEHGTITIDSIQRKNT